MSISLCMIAKDEEELIGNALESVLGFVDEIIVVDTGSTDDTVNIAKGYGAKIIYSKWKKDFSFHRNESIKYAKSNWILFLDCDEVLKFNNKEQIKKIIESSPSYIKGYNINIVNIINGSEIASFEALRIFRNNERFKFENPIHEQVLNNIINKYGEESIGYIPVAIHHYGYNDDIQIKKDKRKRNLEILREIKNKDGYFYSMLGDEYLQMNDLSNASLNYKKALKEVVSYKDGYCKTLVVNYITTLINMKDYNEALKLIDDILKEESLFKDLYFLKFWIYYYSSEFNKALTELEMYIYLNDEKNKGIISVKNFGAIYDLNNIKESLKEYKKEKL